MTLPSPTPCNNCGSINRWFSHTVNLRGNERNLCTSCVLRLHPSTFCPSCFEFFDHPLSTTSANRFLSCVKCSSLTHLRCLPSPPPSPSSFLCPPCATPNFSFFRIDPNTPRIDKSLSIVLLCATKIASASMVKALTFANTKADRTARESALAKKRAKDALEHVCALETAKRNLVASMEVSGSRNLGTREVNPVNKLSANGDNKNGFRDNGNGGNGKLERVQSNHGI